MTMRSVRQLALINRLFVGLGVVGILLLSSGAAYADQLDDQITAAQQDAASQANSASALHQQANNYQDQVAQYNAQINVVQAQINLNQAKADKVASQIADAQARMAAQKAILAENIKNMYLNSGISPLEMLASSSDISDFFNQQQYQDKVKDKIQSALATIEALRVSLDKQQRDLAQLLVSENDQKQQLATTRAQLAQLQALAAQNAAAADQQVKAANAQLASLKAQQAAILAAQYAKSGSNLHVAGNCGGGYPSQASGRFGAWGCSYGKDNGVDNWGMYNQECVSYTAFRIGISGRGNPSGWGNANQWPASARAAGVPVDGNPRAGDVAISMLGTYGHAMYVEGVSGGMINVSQYNFNNTGEFSTMTIPASNLSFIHF
jgi:surface antigen/predicted  nucleic acid-binding Zn-ribbon protein